jgi:hypothetical protein
MAYWLAVIHANLKETNEAFCWLDKAFKERSGMLAYVKVDPRVDYLRSDPRFDDLLRRMNFPAIAALGKNRKAYEYPGTGHHE